MQQYQQTFEYIPYSWRFARKISCKFGFLIAMFISLALPSMGFGQWIITKGPDRGNIFIAANGSNLFAGTRDGIYRSANNGVSWSPVNTGFTGTLAGFTSIGTNIFVSNTENSVFRSIDSGTNWTQLPVAGSSPTIEASGTILYVDATRRSLDSGTTWKTLDALGLISKRNAFIGFGSYIYTGTPEGAMLSIDSGMNWKSRNDGLPPKKNVQSLAKIGTNLFLATLESGVYRSSDSGTTWVESNTGLTSLAAHALLANGTDLIAGTDGGIFKSKDNGLNWISISDSLPVNPNVRTLALIGTSLFAGTSESGLFRTNDNGKNWTYIYNGLTKIPIQSILTEGIKIYAGSGGSGVYVSTNKGENWSPINSGLTNLNVTSLAGNFVGTDIGVFLGSLSGSNWNWTSFMGGGGNIKIRALRIQGGNLIAATDRGEMKSLTSGPTWTAPSGDTCSHSLLSSGLNFFELSCQGDVRLSTDSGKSYTTLAHSWPSSLNAISHAVIASNLFIGTSGGGVFFSSNKGITWNAVNTGLPLNATVQSLGMSAENLFSGVDFGNVWRLQLLPIPTLISPADNATNQPRNPTFFWNLTSGAVTYKLQISTSPSFSALVFEDSTLTGLSKYVDSLLKDTTYYWRVEAKNSWGFRLFSNTRRFSTGSSTFIRSQIPASRPSIWAIEPLRHGQGDIQLKLMVPTKGFVEVRVITADGKEFLNISQYLQAGEYFIHKNGLFGRSSGYF